MFLMMRSGMDAVVLDMHMGSSPVQLMTSGVGGRLPLGAGPGSSAILAMQDEAVREQVMAVNASRYRGYGVDPELVRCMVGDAIARGHSVSKGDIHPGAGGVGVPLFERDGSCVAAITASTVEPHLTPENFARLVAAIEDAVQQAA
jgi:DNA-binding IclR family transcriptional regulator